MSKIILVTLLIFQVGCSNIKPLFSNRGEGVDLGEISSPENKTDLDKKNEPKPVETLRVGGERSGELFIEEKSSEIIIQKKLKLGLSLGPGLMGTIAYINILKNFYRYNIVPQVVTGVEFGAIVAAMYAVGMTPEVIEWNFTKYLREKKSDEIYSREWIEEIDELLLSKLKNFKIEGTKIKFVVTLFDHSLKKVVYFDKGNIRDLILLNLKLNHQAVALKSGVKYSGALEREIHNPRFLNKLGADFIVTADVLNNKSELNVVSGHLQGIYGAAISRLSKERQVGDFYFDLSSKKTQFDNDSMFNAFVLETSLAANKQMIKLNKLMQEKSVVKNQEDLGVE